MQPQVAGCDQSFQLRYAPPQARGAPAHPVTSSKARLLRSKPTLRGAAGSSTNNVLHATLATTPQGPNTHPLRCSAVEHTQCQQESSVDLQSQVDRLTKLLDTLQAASGWHDKARPKLNVLAGTPQYQDPTTMFASRSWLCKTSLGLKPSSALTGKQLRQTPTASARIHITHIMLLLYRHKDLLLQELVSLSAEEVYTILCLPAMSQEHVLTSPLPEGRHSITLVAMHVTAQNLVPAPGPSISIIIIVIMAHHDCFSCRHQLPHSSATAGIHPETGGNLLQQHWGPSGVPPQMLTDHDGEIRSAGGYAWPVSRGGHFPHAPWP